MASVSHLKKQILTFVLKIRKKSTVKYSIEKSILVKFVGMSTILDPRLYSLKHFQRKGSVGDVSL